MIRGARKHTLAGRDPEQHVRGCAAAAAFVYVLPCRFEDILKVGFSRDPLVRMQSLHPRYFEFFDLDRVLLVRTEAVLEARALESELFQVAALHSAPAPLSVSAAAGGHTEWYRGAYRLLCEALESRARSAGFTLHAPAGGWLRARLEQESAALYETCTQILHAIESARCYEEPAPGLEAQLRNRLDAYAALDLEIAHRLPPPVLAWYRGTGAARA